MVVDIARALGEAQGEPLDSQVSRLARLVFVRFRRGRSVSDVVASVMRPTQSRPRATTGNPIKLSGVPDDVGYPAERGEHNVEIYGGLLGYEASAIQELSDRKVI